MKLLKKLVWFIFVAELILSLHQVTSAELGVIDIGLYWDEGCSNPVSSVDFGMLAKGESGNVTFWLKNNSTDKIRISWGSANFDPSSNGLTESCERKVGRSRYISTWKKKLKPGDLWEVHYIVQVAQNIQVGNYVWDLTISYVVSDKIHCLSIPCVLSVAE